MATFGTYRTIPNWITESPTIRPELLRLPKSRFLDHNQEINIRVATVRLERLGNSYAHDPRSPSWGPCRPSCNPNISNQGSQSSNTRHLIEEAPEASDLQMPEG